MGIVIIAWQLTTCIAGSNLRNLTFGGRIGLMTPQLAPLRRGRYHLLAQALAHCLGFQYAHIPGNGWIAQMYAIIM